jgi:hypothetical protein
VNIQQPQVNISILGFFVSESVSIFLFLLFSVLLVWDRLFVSSKKKHKQKKTIIDKPENSSLPSIRECPRARTMLNNYSFLFFAKSGVDAVSPLK